jgi:hypothetical protein
MHKHTASILLFLFISLTTLAQVPDFEGIVTFRSDYRLSVDPAKIDQLKQSFGDSLRLYVRGNNYKQHYRNSNWLQEVTYLGNQNRYFMVFQRFDTIYSMDCGMMDDRYLVYVDTNDRRKILGYECIKLVMQGEQVKKTYFFAPALSLSQADYSKHKMGGYDLYMKNARAVYLYLRVENLSGVQEYTAVKVDRKKLPDKVFELLPLPVK